MPVNIPPDPNTILHERAALECELLYLLELEPGLTQRALARRSGISLGRVNACLKQLVQKGWLALEPLPSPRRRKYVVTPGGLSHRAQTAPVHLRRKRAEHEWLRLHIDLIERDLARRG
ncbi:MarR family transcriptional regulator [Qipengyuania sp. CAU 1752]